MKIFLNITKDIKEWSQVKKSVPIATEYLKEFGVEIVTNYIDFDVSNEEYYEITRSWSWFEIKETKSLSNTIIRGLGIAQGGLSYDYYGLMADKEKSKEGALYGQHDSKYKTIEVYAGKTGTRYGYLRTVGSLIHEILHALSSHLGIKDQLHEYIDKYKGYDEYKKYLLENKKTAPEKTIWDELINFKKSEFKNPDKIKPEALRKLQAFRSALGEPVRITSDQRNSGSHIDGYEIDIAIPGDKLYKALHIVYKKGTGGNMWKIIDSLIELPVFANDKQAKAIKIAKQVGYTRIGLYNGHMHLGINPTSPQFVLWTGVSE